ncbi:MAG: pantetheine-phosphate adenylyltransferase [Candidatus Izimaplasma sp.]|nr:pantetheine-phosphate adenylyltransferase [Candidatus Izimaplasma bacterium]
MKVAVYPGSFDPITYGHIDIAKRALKVFDRLIILINVHPNKHALFSAEARKDMVEVTMKEYLDRMEVVIANDLTVDETKKLGATHMVRGLRAVTDFEYEFQLTHANRVLDNEIDSIYFMTDNKYSFLSSALVKEIGLFKGDLAKFIPPYVVEKMKEKLK